MNSVFSALNVLNGTVHAMLNNVLNALNLFIGTMHAIFFQYGNIVKLWLSKWICGHKFQHSGNARQCPGNTPAQPPKVDQKGLLRMPLRLSARSYVTDNANFDDFPLPFAVGNVGSAQTWVSTCMCTDQQNVRTGVIIYHYELFIFHE